MTNDFEERQQLNSGFDAESSRAVFLGNIF